MQLTLLLAIVTTKTTIVAARSQSWTHHHEALTLGRPMNFAVENNPTDPLTVELKLKISPTKEVIFNGVGCKASGLGTGPSYIDEIVAITPGYGVFFYQNEGCTGNTIGGTSAGIVGKVDIAIWDSPIASLAIVQNGKTVSAPQTIPVSTQTDQHLPDPNLRNPSPHDTEKPSKDNDNWGPFTSKHHPNFKKYNKQHPHSHYPNTKDHHAPVDNTQLNRNNNKYHSRWNDQDEGYLKFKKRHSRSQHHNWSLDKKSD